MGTKKHRQSAGEKAHAKSKRKRDRHAAARREIADIYAARRADMQNGSELVAAVSGLASLLARGRRKASRTVEELDAIVMEDAP